jgi:hypothetical protein
MKGIRLPADTIHAICQAFQESFLKDDRLWLFGSRADLDKRGGDIDLFVESSIKDAQKIVEARSQFYKKLCMRLGEQKIDIIIKFDETDLLIYKIAKEEGVRLI